MLDVDYQMGIDSSGLMTYQGGAAVNNNIMEWLNTPMYSVADRPAWGHNLEQFHFAPQTENTAVMIEMAIAEKLPYDVRGILLSGILVEWKSIDRCHIVIKHQYDFFDASIAL